MLTVSPLYFPLLQVPCVRQLCPLVLERVVSGHIMRYVICPKPRDNMTLSLQKCHDPLWEPWTASHGVYFDFDDETVDPCSLCNSKERHCIGYAVCWRCWTLVAWRSWWMWQKEVGELPAALISTFWLGPWNVTRLHYDPEILLVLNYELLSRWSFGRSLLQVTFEDACRYAAGAFLVPWTRRQAKTVPSLQCFTVPILFAGEMPGIKKGGTEIAEPGSVKKAEVTAIKPHIRTYLRQMLGARQLCRLRRKMIRTNPSLQWIWGPNLLMIAYSSTASEEKKTEAIIETLLANVCLASNGSLYFKTFEIQETILQVLQFHSVDGVPSLDALRPWTRQLGHKCLLYVAFGSKSDGEPHSSNTDGADADCRVLQGGSAWRAQTMLQQTLEKWGIILPRHG